MTAAVQTSATTPRLGAALESEARAWMEEPFSHFGMSNTAIHSVPRKEADAVQLAALNLRLAERRAQIPVLAKLADAQGIRSLATLEDAAPLLFEHTVYKSYPISLLSKQRFDQLTQWLGRLTPHDISGVDVSQCKSIDEWLTLLQKETPLDVATSSGTSGTISFFPKSKRDYMTSVRGFRVQLAQEFGAAPTPSDLNDKIYVLTPLYRDGHSSTGAFARYLLQVMCLGDESYLHTAFPYKISSDLMWLAARLRAAAAKGDVTRVDVPESLLARRGELEAMQRDTPAQRSAFIRNVAKELAGKRVFAMGTTPMFYEVAKRGLEEGMRGVFTKDSIVMGGGGHKGMVLPEDCDQTIMDFFGVPRLKMCYGMTELNAFSVTCERGHYHFLPWVALFILDPETGKPLPRSGVQTGRASFFDMTHDGTWGGIVTGDKITVDWDTPCPCGRTSVYLQGGIQRFSELQGGDDKITCAATPAAQNDAMDFLLTLEV
jgi:hypothetical protein